MSSYNATFFLDPQSQIRSTTEANPVLYVEPDGEFRGSVAFQFSAGTSLDEQLQIADRFVRAVTAWRDELAAMVKREQSLADELAQDRAEIARLKGEREDGEGQ